MPDSKVEVKACRKCGGTARYREDGLWFVECSVCGEYEGPHARKVEAKKMWNIKNTIANNGVSVEDIKKVLYKDCIGRCIAPNAEGYEYRSHPDKLAEALTKLQPTAINNGVSFDSIVDKLTHLNGDHLMGLELNDIHIIANFITRLQTTAPRGGQ